MSIVRCKDSRRGVTYVYESVNYWDKQAKKYKARRRCIGKLDDDGNIIPTRGRPGRPPKPEGTQREVPNDEKEMQHNLEARLSELTRRLSEVESELKEKDRKLRMLKKDLSAIVEKLDI